MAAFGRILVLVVVVSFQVLFEKVLKNKNVQAFGPILVLVLPFFPKNNINRATVNSTNRWHTAAYLFLALLFSKTSSLIARKLKILISTRRILDLVVVFSFQILLEKVLKNGSFWSNLGFGCVFSCSNST